MAKKRTKSKVGHTDVKSNGKKNLSASKAAISAVEIASRQRHLLLLGKVRDNQALTAKELEELDRYEVGAKVGGQSKKNSSAYEADGYDPAIHIKLQKDAAKYAGVCVRVLRRWKNKRGMPVSKEGWYLKGMIDIWKSKDSGEEGVVLAEHRQRDTIAIAGLRETKEELLKLELAERKGQSHNVAECRARSVEKVIAIKRAILGQGRKLAPRLVNKTPAQIKKIIDDDNKSMIRIFSGVTSD